MASEDLETYGRVAQLVRASSLYLESPWFESMHAHRNTYMDISPGAYKHFKGNEYQVIGIAKHSETQEKLVVYRALYDDHELWVRPLAMFIETVKIDGKQVPRFTKIE